MRAATALFVLLAVVASATRARAGEPGFRPLPSVGTCLRATGERGGLALLGPLGRRSSATDLVTVGSAEIAPAARTTLGNLIDCAAVDADPSGAAVMAATVRRGRGRMEVWAALRDPGQAFARPVRLGAASERARRVVAAVSARGDAVVAWAQVRGSALDEDVRLRIVAARRPAGGRFAAVEPLTPWGAADTGALDMGAHRLAAGAGDAGGLTVA